jgi:hypothetical protein
LKIKNFLFLFSVSLILLPACQKSDLKKDGYFILKINNSRVSFDKCVFWCENNIADTTPVHLNNIVAYKKKDVVDTAISNYENIMIYFDGDTCGTYSNQWLLPGPNACLAYIMHKGINYGPAEMILKIEKYDIENKIIEGSLSGKFQIGGSLETTAEIKESPFRAIGSE